MLYDRVGDGNKSSGMLWRSLGQFWKLLIKIKELKSLIFVSLTPKKIRAVELLGNFCGVLQQLLVIFGNITTSELKVQ